MSANSLSELPRGLQTFAGVQFDVSGLVQVGGTYPTGEAYPRKGGRKFITFWSLCLSTRLEAMQNLARDWYEARHRSG